MAADPAIAVLAEAIVRLEYKLDLLMMGVGVSGVLPPMHFVGHQCPVCKKVIDYQVDIQHQVVKRICGCSTGKQPSVIPLVPVPTGAVNGTAADAGRAEAPGVEEPAPDRRRGEGR